MSQLPANRKSQGGRLATRGEDPFDRLQRDLGSLVGRLMGGWLTPLGQGMTPRLWDLDVNANDQEVVVRAEIPGFDENEIDVRLDRDVLTIQAEKQKKGDGREEYRTYFETVTLPSGINADGARATYRNGVLELHIPRSEEARPRRIAIGGQEAGARQGQQASSGQSEAAAARASTQGAQQGGQQQGERTSGAAGAKAGK